MVEKTDAEGVAGIFWVPSFAFCAEFTRFCEERAKNSENLGEIPASGEGRGEGVVGTSAAGAADRLRLDSVPAQTEPADFFKPYTGHEFAFFTQSNG